MGSILCHITPLVINSLRGEHTHTYILTIRTGSILRNQEHTGLWPACARFKKKQLRTKTSFAEKDVKSNGQPILPGFDRFESFGYDELTAIHCFSGAQGLLMLY